MTPTELAVKVDKVVDTLGILMQEAQTLSNKRKNSQYLIDAVQALKRGSNFLDKAMSALLRRGSTEKHSGKEEMLASKARALSEED